MTESLKRPLIIIVAALLFVVVILLVGFLAFKATEQATFDEFNQRQLVLAREAASGIELYFEHLASDLRTLAGTPEIQQLDESPTRQRLQAMLDELKPWGVNDVAILDAGGRVRYTAAAPPLEGVDLSWREYYQEAASAAPNDPYLIEFIEFQGVEAGTWGVLIAVPMFERGASGPFAGVVVGTLKLDTLTQKFVAPIKSSDQGHAFLLDQGNNVLWSPDGSLFGRSLLEAAQGFPSFQRVLQDIGAGGSGVTEFAYWQFQKAGNNFVRGKTEQYLIAYAPLRLGSQLWSIGVWSPKQEARKLIRSAYLSQLGVVVLGILVILLGSVYALATSFRFNKFLKREVEAKAGELRASHERLRTVLNSLEAAVHVTDMETKKILFVNERFRQLWGNAVGKPCPQIWQARGAAFVDHCPSHDLLNTAGEPTGVFQWEFQDTISNCWYEIRNRAIRWVDGRTTCLEIAVDITERHKALKALEAAHAFQQSVIDGMGEPLIVVGADYRVKLMNRAAREFSWANHDPSPPLFCYQVSHTFEAPCSEAGHPCPMELVRASGQQVTVMHEHYLADGARRFVEIVAAPLHAADGTFAGIIECIRDVTERKWAEEALSEKVQVLTRSHDELEQFSYKVVRSIQDFFDKLPPDSGAET